MLAVRLGVAMVLAGMMLGGCSRSPFAAPPNPNICAPVPPARSGSAGNSYEAAVHRDECLHRFGYRFALAPDSAEQVVGAVIGACRPQIDRSAVLLANGDEAAETYYLAEMERVARERALYRVVQARAGHCS